MIKNISTISFVLALSVSVLVVPVAAAAAAATTSQAICPSCTNLESLYENMLTRIPGAYSNDYMEPPDSVMDDFELIVGDMLSGLIHCDSIPLRSLSGLYDIRTFQDQDNHKEYCVLATTSISFPWGNVIVNNQDYSAKNLSFDAVHPLFDGNTGLQSLVVFKGTNARSFLLSGSHRKASSSQFSTCDGTFKDGTPYSNSDAAHVLNCMQRAAKAVMEYYGDQDYTAIQFHGMGTNSCSDIDAYLTHGTSIAPLWGEKIDMLRNELCEQEPMALFTVPGDAPSCTLGGNTNTLGRMINGIPASDACTVPALTYTGRFIHIEQKPWLRHPDFYDMWIDAINNVYPLLPSATKPRQTQTGEGTLPLLNNNNISTRS